jgi:hypothetical protein
LTKRSAQSNPSSQPKPVFFIDRCLGSGVVFDALRKAGWSVKRHDDHFPPGTEDTEWIKGAGQNGWIILSADGRIRYNPAEKKALMESGTLAFLLAGGNNRKAIEMAAGFLKAQVKILRLIKKQRPPGIFKVYPNDGRVILWTDGD